MGLIKLINNLDNATKTRLLGPKITELLRYTFVNNDYEAINSEVLSEAVAVQVGHNLVARNRSLLIESCRTPQLKSLGFDNHDEAINHYRSKLDEFVEDFKIEKQYLIESPLDLRENYEVIIPKYGENNGFQAFPHPYQYRMKNVILQMLYNDLNPIILASMPTGAGKTVLGMEIIIDLFRSYEPYIQKPINIIWLVNSNPLAEQSFQSFQRLWKQKGDHKVIAERYFGKFNKLKKTSNSKITFATFDLVTARIRSEEVKGLIEKCDFLFIDEVHSSEAHTYSQVLKNYREVNEKFKITGLTATPYRSDDDDFQSLKGMFKEYLTLTNERNKEVESPIQYLIEHQYLSNITTEIFDISEGQISNSEYYKSLHNAILTECIRLIDNNENTIIFAQSKAHAVAVSIFLKQNGIENGLIVGETPDVYRQKYLKDFGDKDKPLSVLVNHQILSTGIDVPGMNSIMILSDIGSPALALQILGRAMRGPKNGGNESNTIYLTPSNQAKLKEYKTLESIVIR